MFGLFDSNSQRANAIDLLKSDHDEVEKLFDEYDDRKEDADAQTKQDIVDSICKALEVHAQLEEELFYPAFRNVDEMEDLLDEAVIEHQSVKHLVAQLEASTPDDMLYDAKVKVLAEYVKHHVREEEGEIFPKARSSEVDLDVLGRKMTARKEELAQGEAVPAIEEELAPRTARGRGQTQKARGASTKATSRKTSGKGAGTTRRASARAR